MQPENREESNWDVFFAPTGNFNGEEGKPLKLIRQGALLRITGGNTYSFFHHSLLEYFASKKLFTSAANKAAIAMGLEINTQLITAQPAMIRLGVDCVNQDKAFEEALWEILEESKHESRVQVAAANAATLLAAANRSFAGKDLRRIRIPKANVSGGNFEGTDLREADLRDVNVSQAWLARANLTGSCVDRLATGELLGEELGEEVIGCAFTGDGKHYVVVTEMSVIVYQTVTHKKVHSYKPKLDKEDFLNAFALSSKATLIGLGTENGVIMILSFPKGNLQRQWNGHEKRITALVISPNGRWALSGSFDNTIKRWDVETGGCMATWQGHTGSVYALALSPDGRWALSGSNDKTIKRWDVETGGCMATWQGHTWWVEALVLSPDGRWALSGSDDKTIKRWDVETGGCMATWQGHTDRCERIGPESRWPLGAVGVLG